jgi:hypothetical protein
MQQLHVELLQQRGGLTHVCTDTECSKRQQRLSKGVIAGNPHDIHAVICECVHCMLAVLY